MTGRTGVAVLFGGRSAEHEVSVVSASNVYRAIDRRRFEVTAIGIDHDGTTFLVDGSKFDVVNEEKSFIKRAAICPLVASLPHINASGNRAAVFERIDGGALPPIEVVFPVLHGTYGEDGTMQGFLKLAGLPFVGAGVLGSAVGMDKAVMKCLLRDGGVPIGKFLVVSRADRKKVSLSQIGEELGMPCFIKPANLGSSVGISKAGNENELRAAIDLAFQYDNRIIVEEFIDGREIECAVLGNENPKSSLPGEIVPAAAHGFYSYEAKYLDPKGAELKYPAELSPELGETVKKIAVQAFKVLCCEGMGRVDMFLKPDGEVLLNEINTIPGFTSISMYPKLWEVSGLPYEELITKLIELALERSVQEDTLITAR